MDPEMDPTKPENDSQSKSREQTVQTSDSQPRYNPSITFHSLRNDLLMTPRGALITPIQARVSRDTSDGNVISRAQSPCDSLTHIIRSSLCSEFNADTSYICEHTHAHTQRLRGYELHFWLRSRIHGEKTPYNDTPCLSALWFVLSRAIWRAAPDDTVERTRFWTEIATTGSETLTCVMFSATL